MQQRDSSIDIIRFIAILFITNSHFQPLYYFCPSLATLGVHGNALFFFISGYVLSLGSTYSCFIDWFKKRISRIWPTIIVWSILGNLIFNKEISWEDLLIAKDYWFIQCIVIYYIFLYFINKLNVERIKYLLIISLVGFVFIILLSPQSYGSIYHGFHYVCYFPSMLLGLYFGKIKQNKIPLVSLQLIISFILYFLIMYIGKGKDSCLYYTQIIAIIPLNYFVICLFLFFKRYSFSLQKSYTGKVIFFISSLSLEIYIVQFSIISGKYNDLFPLSLFIIFLQIILMAYILKIFSNILIQTISKEKYNISGFFKTI